MEEGESIETETVLDSFKITNIADCANDVPKMPMHVAYRAGDALKMLTEVADSKEGIADITEDAMKMLTNVDEGTVDVSNITEDAIKMLTHIANKAEDIDMVIESVDENVITEEVVDSGNAAGNAGMHYVPKNGGKVYPAEKGGTVFMLTSVEEMHDLINQYSEKTASHFVIRKRSKHFGFPSLECDLEGHRVQWADPHNNNQVEHIVKFDGIPHLTVGNFQLACQFGKEKSEFKKRAENTSERKRFHKNPTKKCGCPCTIRVKQIIKFPEFQISQDTEKRRRQGAFKLKEMLKKCRNKLKSEVWIIGRLPDYSEHKYHESMEGLIYSKEVIHPELLQRIKELYFENKTNTEILNILQDYLKNNLFYEQELPPPNRRRYYPLMRDLRNITSRCREKSKISEEEKSLVQEVIEKTRYHNTGTSNILLRFDTKEIKRENVKNNSEKENVKNNSETEPSEDESSNTKKEGRKIQTFVFCYQSPEQQKLMKIYGQEVSYLVEVKEARDVTFSQRKVLSYKMFMLMVQTNVDFQVVGCIITTKLTQHEGLVECLNCFRLWNSDWVPKYFFVDCYEDIYQPLTESFPTVNYFFNHESCETEWKKFIKTPFNDIEKYADEVMSHLKHMEYCLTEDSLALAAANLEQSEVWQTNEKFRMFFQESWLPLAKRWVFGYRPEDMIVMQHIAVTIPQCLQVYTKALNSAAKLNGFVELVECITNSLSKDGYKNYVERNQKHYTCSDHYKNSNSFAEDINAVPISMIPYLHGVCKMAHCNDFIIVRDHDHYGVFNVHVKGEACLTEDGKTVNISEPPSRCKTNSVISFTDYGALEYPAKPHPGNYNVSFGDYYSHPFCTCAHWLFYRLPCIHMFAVFGKIPDWKYNMLSPSYRGNPVLNIDMSCVQLVKVETTEQGCQTSKFSCDCIIKSDFFQPPSKMTKLLSTHVQQFIENLDKIRLIFKNKDLHKALRNQLAELISSCGVIDTTKDSDFTTGQKIEPSTSFLKNQSHMTITQKIVSATNLLKNQSNTQTAQKIPPSTSFLDKQSHTPTKVGIVDPVKRMNTKTSLNKVTPPLNSFMMKRMDKVKSLDPAITARKNFMKNVRNPSQIGIVDPIKKDTSTQSKQPVKDSHLKKTREQNQNNKSGVSKTKESVMLSLDVGPLNKSPIESPPSKNVICIQNPTFKIGKGVLNVEVNKNTELEAILKSLSNDKLDVAAILPAILKKDSVMEHTVAIIPPKFSPRNQIGTSVEGQPTLSLRSQTGTTTEGNTTSSSNQTGITTEEKTTLFSNQTGTTEEEKNNFSPGSQTGTTAEGKKSFSLRSKTGTTAEGKNTLSSNQAGSTAEGKRKNSLRSQTDATAEGKKTFSLRSQTGATAEVKTTSSSNQTGMIAERKKTFSLRSQTGNMVKGKTTSSSNQTGSTAEGKKIFSLRSQTGTTAEGKTTSSSNQTGSTAEGKKTFSLRSQTGTSAEVKATSSSNKAHNTAEEKSTLLHNNLNVTTIEEKKYILSNSQTGTTTEGATTSCSYHTGTTTKGETTSQSNQAGTILGGKTNHLVQNKSVVDSKDGNTVSSVTEVQSLTKDTIDKIDFLIQSCRATQNETFCSNENNTKRRKLLNYVATSNFDTSQVPWPEVMKHKTSTTTKTSSAMETPSVTKTPPSSTSVYHKTPSRTVSLTSSLKEAQTCKSKTLKNNTNNSEMRLSEMSVSEILSSQSQGWKFSRSKLSTDFLTPGSGDNTSQKISIAEKLQHSLSILNKSLASHSENNNTQSNSPNLPSSENNSTTENNKSMSKEPDDSFAKEPSVHNIYESNVYGDTEDIYCGEVEVVIELESHEIMEVELESHEEIDKNV